MLGQKTLNAITSEDIQRVKVALATRAPKTVNNVLTVLNTMMKKAVEWDVLPELPCRIRLLPTPISEAEFLDFDAYEALVRAASDLDWRAELIALLGGEAGLRCGEMMALESSDVQWTKPQLCVARSEWKGQVTTTKGGKLRYVPLTVRLTSALRQHRHLRSKRILVDEAGQPLTLKVVESWMLRACRVANVPEKRPHVLRHTFCSHLAMRGASTKAIQGLAGHQNITTTQRYMHLSPAALEDAIRLLDRPVGGREGGDILETGDRETAKSHG
jgi:integrase